MRFLLYLLWSAISLLVITLVLITLLLTVFQAPLEERLVHSIEQATGRDIVIEDGFSFRFNPRPTFIARGVKMANAAWARHPWMLEVDALQASLSLSQLLKGKIKLYSIEGKTPKILIEQQANTGKINWHFTSKRTPRPFEWLADNLSIEVATISDAQIEIEVGAIKHDLALEVIVGRTNYFNRLINIQALGEMDAKPLTLELQLDNLRNMFLRAPTGIEFEGLHGATQITGHGQVQDLFRWWGHDIELELVVPSLKEVQGWVTSYLIDTPELRATARFVQPERWDSARFDGITVKSDALDGYTRISGSVRQLRGMNGIELTGELHYPLASLMKWKGLESQTDAQIDANITLSGNKTDALAFYVHSASLMGEGIELRGQGSIKHLLQETTQGIPFKGTLASARTLGQVNARQWFDTDLLSGGFELKKRNGRLALENIEISSFTGRAILTGDLQDIARTQRGTFELNADLLAEDINTLNALNETRLPVFEQSELGASIDMLRSDFSAHDVHLNLRSKGLLISGIGDIQELKSLRMKAVKVTLEALSIADINAQFASKFPELGRFHASGELRGDLKNLYHFNDLNLILENDHQTFSGSGSLRRLGPEMLARLNVEADINSLTNIPPLLDSSIRVPDRVQGHGTASLTARRFDDWSLNDIKIQFEGANQGVVGGSVTHFPAAADYALTADFRRLSSVDLPAFEMIETLKPENIHAYMHINKLPEQDSFSVNNIDISFGLASGVATANIAGSVADINHFTGLSLQIGLSSSDLHAVPYLSKLPLKADLTGIARLKLSGRPDHLGISVSSLEVSDTELHGELIFQSTPGRKPILKGRLGSKNLDLLGLLQQEERTSLFSAEALEFDWVNQLNANINIKADFFNGMISQWENANLNISIQNGIFSMPSMHGEVGEGNVAAWLSIVAQRKPYNIVASFKAVDIKPEHINLFGDSGFIREGKVDVDIGLGGSGNSIAEFMGNAYGKIQLELTDSQLKHRNLKLFGADLISGVFDIIDTLSGEAIYLPIECGVMHFPVVRGQAVASQGIAIKTNDITVLGGGIIDLKHEDLEIIFRTKPRKGLGISAGTVTNIIKISGSINEPKIAVDASSLIKTSATIGAAIVSGGWTLLVQGLLDKNIANSDVCQQTLEEPNAEFFKQTQNAFEEVSGEH